MEKNVGQCLMVFQVFSVVYSVTLNDMHFFCTGTHTTVLSVNLYFFYTQHKIKKIILAAHP